MCVPTRYDATREDLAELLAGQPRFRVDQVLHGLYDYIERHQAPGHFLTAVLCHDLFEATGRSDEGSWIALRELVVFIYNEVRSDCHGSPAKVSAWLQNTVGSL